MPRVSIFTAHTKAGCQTIRMDTVSAVLLNATISSNCNNRDGLRYSSGSSTNNNNFRDKLWLRNRKNVWERHATPRANKLKHYTCVELKSKNHFFFSRWWRRTMKWKEKRVNEQNWNEISPTHCLSFVQPLSLLFFYLVMVLRLTDDRPIRPGPSIETNLQLKTSNYSAMYHVTLLDKEIIRGTNLWIRV